MEEFWLCSWAWTKNRHKKISSIARFSYALEPLLIDGTMDDVSNSGVEEKARSFGGLIRLDNEVNENPSRRQK